MAAEYRLVFSDNLRAVTRAMVRAAEARGHGASALSSLRRLEHRMRTSPKEHGDPAYGLPSGLGTVYRDMQGVICAYYAVYEAPGIVWVVSITRISFPGE